MGAAAPALARGPQGLLDELRAGGLVLDWPSGFTVRGWVVERGWLARLLPGWCAIWLVDAEGWDEPISVEGPSPGERLVTGCGGGEVWAVLILERERTITILGNCTEVGWWREQLPGIVARVVAALVD